MEQTKKAKVKKMILNAIGESGARKYKTTYKDIKKYFKVINEAVFNNELSPFNDVEILDLRRQKVWGQVIIQQWKRKGTRQYKLEMSTDYPDKSAFLNTLGHEMVHLYQMANCGDSGNHNKLFYSFKPKLKSIGLGEI